MFSMSSKLTAENIDLLSSLRTGIGFDSHRFSDNRKLVLGGVEIDYSFGLQGHSDADVVIHAIIDSLLSAAGEGDIGKLFPDTDPAYKNINSLELLSRVCKILKKKSVIIINVDTVVICEAPKIGPYIDSMKKKLSDALGGLPVSRIGIKGKTTEKMGFTGRREGIAVQAVSLISLSENFT